MFTARYALSPYIKQIRFVFKGLIYADSVLRYDVLHRNKANQNNTAARYVKKASRFLLKNLHRSFADRLYMYTVSEVHGTTLWACSMHRDD
jgi:hypothetical protein